ncbi:hypothetical protein CAPTEDRAFT_154877 [Capitella teleta]|uniref:Gelsolin-like domain-containing protein n=1 Tax=Capitella teleta TaxID=283909 RepID=R7TSM5_CAPTE|nr:hypothetical protein CAPTEDRAFT_154877 [Capitella teleta]|eukprot:ELT94030.1 hypothetical protein CAPTEDRAFT_154877 [Capitella teleta]
MGRDAVTEDYLTSVVKLHELDTFLGKRGIVHREVQGFESGVFLKYFNPITLWKGSSDQNYRQTQVKKSNHSARLLVFFKPDPHMTQVIVKEVSTHGLELDNTRIYIMDLGSRLIQWIGCLVGTELALLGLKYTEGIRASRGLRSKVEVINEKLEEDESATLSRHPFYVYLSKDSYRSGRNGSQDLSSSVPIFPSMLRAPKSSVSRLSRIVKNKSKIEYQKVKEGNISLKDLEKAQFAIFENGLECYVWLSNKIPASDANVALEHSHNYLMNSKHPTVPVTILRESQNSAAFQKALVA